MSEKLTNTIKKHKRKFLFAIAFVFGIAAIGRLVKICGRDVFNDFNAYYDVVDAIVRGLNPYDLTNLNLKWVDPPIVFPGYTIFLLPFVLINLNIAKYAFLFLNVILSSIIFYSLFKKAGFINKPFDKNNLSFPGFLISLFAFMNSVPYLACLKHGQISIVISTCLIILFTLKKSWQKIILFSVAAALKYSMLPLYAVLLFVKRKFFLCIASFIVFILWALIPIFFGHNLIVLYTEYLFTLHEQLVGGGFNSFAISGYNMLQFDFIKIGWICSIVKLSFAGAFVFVMIKNYKTKKIGLHLLLTVATITMIISYHRVYDMVFVLPLVLLLINLYMKEKKWKHAGILSVFILFFLIPESLLFKISNIIGSAIGENSLIYLNSFGTYNEMFPITPLITAILAIYSLYLFFTQIDIYIFNKDIK
ncbi:MAG: glycosyltransferase family 87 protein [Verrucomicrobiota bacterium]|nr:glycosyltransferase family 87 protein [Verrucomicrobiota bacterium]